MSKISKTMKALALSIATLASFGAWAETETVGEYTWTYRINGDTAEIYYDPYDSWLPRTGAVTIPSTLGGKIVTCIGDDAFSGCSGLTSVTIPSSVTSIGASAFWGCIGLTAVHVTDIAAWCRISFRGLGTNPLYYAHNLFINGEKVEALTIPEGITSIGERAFHGCSGLTSVAIPNSVTNIGSGAFQDCNGLTAIHVTDLASWCGISFDTLGANPLCYAHNLYLNNALIEDLTIPDGVISIGNYAFYGCSGLTSVTIPDSVTSIGASAFYGCSGLTSVTIPDGVTSIGEEAFYNCTELTSVTIPNSVTSLSTTAFDGCGKLWTAWYRTLANASAAGGGTPSVVTTVVQQVESPYALTNAAADRAIASVTVDDDCAIDSFVLKAGEVYDSVLRIVNTANRDVTLTLPVGHVYETFEGVNPLKIPANSTNILTITRMEANTFLVSREKLKTIQQ